LSSKFPSFLQEKTTIFFVPQNIEKAPLYIDIKERKAPAAGAGAFADFSSLDASKDAKIYCRRAYGFGSRAAIRPAVGRF